MLFELLPKQWQLVLPSAKNILDNLSSCTTAAECGGDATCDAATSRCVCRGGLLPCGGGCCPYDFRRDLEIAPSGREPEIGFDDAGTIYVLYRAGSASIVLAEVAPDDTVTTTPIGTSSGNEDAADLVVEPDGRVRIAMHQVGSGRSGIFTLFERAPGASTFTTQNLLVGGPETFAYDAAVAMGRAPNGRTYAVCTARSGDGTMGLIPVLRDETAGVWVVRPTILGYHGHAWSELFAHDAGFFVRNHDLGYVERFTAFDTIATDRGIEGLVSGPIYTRGETAGALRSDGVLGMFLGGRYETSDGATVENISLTGFFFGARSDADMTVTAEDLPVLAFHNTTNHVIGVLVRMPLGGWTGWTWFDATLLPTGVSSTHMGLDAETSPDGELVFAIGDDQERGPLHLRVITP